MSWTGPDLSALDRGDVTRWTPALKEALVQRFEAGTITLKDLLRTYSLTLEEFDSWRQRYRAVGRRGLKATAVQQALPGLDPRPTRASQRGKRHG